jgi:hypothetical protein
MTARRSVDAPAPGNTTLHVEARRQVQSLGDQPGAFPNLNILPVILPAESLLGFLQCGCIVRQIKFERAR